MRILFIGDIMGKPGRKIIEQQLPSLLSEKNIDFTIANAENATHGSGLNKKSFEQLHNFGIDAFTMGNHVWRNRDIFNFIDQEQKIIRPLNLPKNNPGQGYNIFEVCKQKLAVVNLIGQVYMPAPLGANPFHSINKLLKKLRAQKISNIIVDIHAEATSEKIALGWYLDGQVSAVYGTHTHVQTNDARILPRGTAYITDAGMTGPHDSVLGLEKEGIISRFTTQIYEKVPIAQGDLQINGVICETNQSGKTTEIEQVNLIYPSL